MERDTPGGSDVGRDIERDLGDEPPPSYRDSAPDYLAPIDDSSPVSGHTPAPESADVRRRLARARLGPRPGLIYPAFRPVGTQGLDIGSLDRDHLVAQGAVSTPSRCSTSGRPACRSSTRSMPARTTSSSTATTCCRGASGHRRSRTRPCATCRAGRASAPWTDEISGDRRLVSSDTGDGWDAARILLPEVVAHLADGAGRVRPHPRRTARAASADGGVPAARRRPISPRSSRSSSSSSPVAPTSRSTGGSSSWWTGASSNSTGADPRPDERHRRRPPRHSSRSGSRSPTRSRRSRSTDRTRSTR